MLFLLTLKIWPEGWISKLKFLNLCEFLKQFKSFTAMKLLLIFSIFLAVNAKTNQTFSKEPISVTPVHHNHAFEKWMVRNRSLGELRNA